MPVSRGVDYFVPMSLIRIRRNRVTDAQTNWFSRYIMSRGSDVHYSQFDGEPAFYMLSTQGIA